MKKLQGTGLENVAVGQAIKAATAKTLELGKQGVFSQSASVPLATPVTPSFSSGSKVFRDCTDCPEMLTIPAGSFEMGSNNGSSDEKPAHTVRINKAFALGKTEVTQSQWRAVMGSDPPELGFKGGDECPVERVSWIEVQEFIRKLNQKTGKNYRLPSEAEWEYACRAGGQYEFCGADNIDSVAWYSDNSGNKPHPVAGKKANVWGLYDMSGNVYEWTEDCWNSNYNGASTDGSAWTGGSCQSRIVRGGSWYYRPNFARSASRSAYLTKNTGKTDGGFGFRLARTLP